MGICEVLIPLTNSPSSEVQGNSAAALGNLSSKGAWFDMNSRTIIDSLGFADGRTATDDYSAFNDVWDKPDGGMHKYLYRFLSSSDATFQHIAVWTIVQLLESGDPQLISNIRSSSLLNPNIRQLATSRASSPSSSVGTPRSHRSQTHSYQDTDTGEGQGEIQLLARRILEFVDGDGEPMLPRSVSTSHMQPGSSVSESIASGREHEELRQSVRDAFSISRAH
jgi:vacuolar protein 8